MQEYVNADTLFATVSLALDGKCSGVLVVEGADDHLTLKDHRGNEVQVIAGVGGRETVLGAARKAASKGLSSALFLVDRDFEDFLEIPREFGSNVVLSETHDLFMDVIRRNPEIITRVLDVQLDKVRRKLGQPRSPLSIRTRAVRLATCVAAARIVNQGRGVGLDFRRFSLRGWGKIDCEASEIMAEICRRSRVLEPRRSELIQETVAVFCEIQDNGEATVGDHDYFAALARCLKDEGVDIKGETLQQMLIAALRCDALRKVNCLGVVQQWGIEHGFEALDCWPSGLAS